MKNALVIFRIILIATLFATFSLSTTQAATIHTLGNNLHRWERLGSKKVNFRLERDVLRVGMQDGSFSKLKLHVTGGSLKIHKMIVEYGNGQKAAIEVRHIFKQGSGSRIIDLNGNRRVIKDITFFYDSVNRPGRRATLHVFGKH